MQEYPWYKIVEESEELEQGDFIDDFPVIVPTYIPNKTEDDKPVLHPKGVEKRYNLVVVSQSCDLDNGKLEHVLLCPRVTYSQYIASNVHYGSKAITKGLEDIKAGRKHKYCMLNKSDLPDFLSEIQLVELGTVFSVPHAVFKQMVKPYEKRLRLLSPYKEKLAQAFAYYYMRVALPIDIEEFDKVQIQTQIHIPLLVTDAANSG
jgi:hypothetical protein